MSEQRREGGPGGERFEWPSLFGDDDEESPEEVAQPASPPEPPADEARESAPSRPPEPSWPEADFAAGHPEGAEQAPAADEPDGPVDRGGKPESAEEAALRDFVSSEELPAEIDAWEAAAAAEAEEEVAGAPRIEPLEEPEVPVGYVPAEEMPAPLPAPHAEVLAAEPAFPPAEEPELFPAEVEEAAPWPPFPVEEPPEPRAIDGRVARIHLRSGLLALARAELETMAGQGTLDRAALADLAEVRWRSGDLLGAGEAAQAHLARGGEEVLALVVAAEALSAQARAPEARRLAAQVIERTGGELEPIFAGQPRSAIWPPDGIPTLEPPGSLPAGEEPGGGLFGEEMLGEERPAIEPGPLATPEAAAAPVAEPEPAPGEATAVAGRGSSGDLARRAVARELEAIEWSVEHGEFEALPGRLALVLRSDTDQAPRVLELSDLAVELLGGGGGLVAELHLVRGDSFQALGRKSDAAEAYRAAERALQTPPAPVETERPPETGPTEPAAQPLETEEESPEPAESGAEEESAQPAESDAEEGSPQPAEDVEPTGPMDEASDAEQPDQPERATE